MGEWWRGQISQFMGKNTAEMMETLFWSSEELGTDMSGRPGFHSVRHSTGHAAHWVNIQRHWPSRHYYVILCYCYVILCHYYVILRDYCVCDKIMEKEFTALFFSVLLSTQVAKKILLWISALWAERLLRKRNIPLILPSTMSCPTCPGRRCWACGLAGVSTTLRKRALSL